MRVQYVGKKPWQSDELFGTGVVWEGEGDVQTVSDDAGQKMTRAFPGVYGPVSDDHRVAETAPAGAATEVSKLDTYTFRDLDDGEITTLRNASYNGLRRHAKELGINVPRGTDRVELLQIITDFAEVAGAGDQKPPAETPPAEKPPAETPPAETPPAETPPAETPPAETPPPADGGGGKPEDEDETSGDA